MAITVTQLDVANMALALLGQEPLLSFDKDSRNGRAVRLFFEAARVGVLEDNHWSFATKRTILAPDESVPEFGWTQQFTLPSDFLKEQFVLDNGDSNISYRIESGKLLTNNTAPRLIYTWDQKDYSRYSAKFIELLAYKLAAKCAYQITSSRSEEQALFSAYSELLIETMSSDSIGDGEERVVQESTWLANT
jgi:hypothetical protein